MYITYTYDAAGNRISKRITKSGTTTVSYTWYVRDASGNVMATYAASGDSTQSLDSLHLTANNFYLYGSNRIGLLASTTSVDSLDSTTVGYSVPWTGNNISWSKGAKQYELDNHLGNVLVTVSDDKLGVHQTSDSSLIDHYKPVVVNAQDYYPFGMMEQGRIVAGTTGYRYGFNGKEKDDEAQGVGNQIDYGARVYDPRVGRFLSVDPLQKQYPWLTPYQFAGNTPIAAIDIAGKEPLKSTIKEIAIYNKGSLIKITSELTIKVQVINLSSTPSGELGLYDLRGSIQSNFVDQISGSHSATINQAYKWDPEKQEVGKDNGEYQQQVTYDTKVNFQFEVVDAKNKLTNDAIIIGVVDNPKGDKNQDVYGVEDDSYGGALIKASQLKDGAINMLGGKIVSHEIAHLFGASHSSANGDPNNLMSTEGSGTKLTEKQIVEILRFGVGNWDFLWKHKEKGKDLKVDDSKYYNAQKDLKGLENDHE
jgi:RHS repeat-associated protein